MERFLFLRLAKKRRGLAVPCRATWGIPVLVWRQKQGVRGNPRPESLLGFLWEKLDRVE